MVLHLPRKWTIALIIPALFFYAAVTGLHTSSVRAAVMSAVLLAGFFVERKVSALNSLAAAAFLILSWDTNELFSLGFQLSFSVVAAIILLPTRSSDSFDDGVRPTHSFRVFCCERRAVFSMLLWAGSAEGLQSRPQPGSVHFHCFFGISI